MIIMVEATTIKAKAKNAGAPGAGFETKFEMPRFDMPKLDIPVAFRDFAEKGVFQAKESYEKLKSATEEATDVLEATYSSASKGAAVYGMKLIEAGRINTNSAFDFAAALMGAKSFSEAVELTTAHTRKQFETLSEQGKALSALAQKVATESSEPLKTGVSKVFSKVA
jgi:phasin